MSDAYRALFMSAQDAILVCELETGAILDANPAATSLLGYSLEEFTQITGRLLHPPEAWDTVVAAISSALRQRLDHRAPCIRVLRKDGRILYMDCAFNHFELDGQAMYYSQLRDITALVVEQRSRLQQQEEMGSLGRLARWAASEVSTPATYVLANLDFLEDGLQGRPELLEAVQDCQLGLRAIVDCAAQLREGPVGAPARAPSLTDLAGVVTEALAIAKVRVPLAIPPRALVLEVWRQGLLQVLVDLVEGGEWRGLQLSSSGDFHTVSMTGPTPDHLKVDDIFTETGRREPRLAGLQDRAVQLGWQLQVVTEPTARTVHLRLPVNEAGFLRLSDKPRMLIVDDEVHLLRALCRTLGRHFDIQTAHGGMEAWSTLRHDQGFDVVLCDMMMPGLGGQELYRRVSEAWPELAPRFLFMTGATLTARDGAFLARQRTHLLKPFGAEELLHVLAERPQPGLKTKG